RDLTVALSGDGGDEIFGGYRLYRALAARGLLVAVPRGVRAALAALLGRLPSRHGGGATGLVHKARKLLDGLAADLGTQHAAWMSIGDASARRELRPGVGDRALGRALVMERYRRFGGAGLDRTLAVEVDLPLPDDMLAKVDRTSMRHALEVRAPFLDPAIIELALSLPAARHFSSLASKRLLRRALRGVLPARVLRGPKRGFEVPVGHWIAGPLDALYREVTSADALRALPGAEPAAAKRWLADHRARRGDRG